VDNWGDWVMREPSLLDMFEEEKRSSILKHWYVYGTLLVVKVMASAEPFVAQVLKVAGEKAIVRFVLMGACVSSCARAREAKETVSSGVQSIISNVQRNV
jgi:hypothetical protein